jgi:hypothetical protein
VALIATLAMLALLAASLGGAVAVVVAHAQRVSHQRDGLQALYLAEMGIEEALTLAAEGDTRDAIRREVKRPDLTPEAGARPTDTAPGEPLRMRTDSRPVVGAYEVTVRRNGAALDITSTGRVSTPAGRSVTRTVHVDCRPADGGWIVQGWERVP